MQQLTFGWIDYLVFSSLLGSSIIIGMYFAFFSKQDTINEYLYAGKTMAYVPVAVSTLSSMLSGITYLGYPAEVYMFGSQYVMSALGIIVVGLATNYIFLPVYFKLQLLCITEYLELRFSKAARKLCSISYLFSLLAYSAIIIFAPALAFSQLTGVHLHVLTPILTIICIFYTSLGGVKAVIWTDTFQFIFTLGGVVTILILGIVNAGGIGNIWRIAEEGGRIEFFNMNPSFYERATFWTVISGYIFNYLGSFATSQKHVQKLLSIQELKQARKAVWLIIFLTLILSNICYILGLTIYAKYHGCDPLKAQYIKSIDQILPYFVMDIAGTKAGLPGIFLAGLISSALATLSATLNTLGSVIYDDFLRQWLPKSFDDEAKAANVIKVIIVIVGFVAIGMVFMAEKMGTIFELASSFISIIAGPILGLYILGMVLPWIGNKGALVGGYSSLIFMILIVVGSKWYTYKGTIRYNRLPTTIEDCPFVNNATLITTTLKPLLPEDEPLFIFKISILHYAFIGTFICVTLGVIITYITKETDLSKINPDHITPIMQRYLPKKKYIEVPLENIKKNEKYHDAIDLDSENNV